MVPPQYALWACWAFALFLLWRDTKKRPDVPLTVWLPTLWLMRCGSRSIDYWLSSGDSDIGRMDPILISVLMLIGMIILVRRRCNWGGIVGQNSWLFIFYGYLILSELWVDNIENPLVKVFRPVGDFVVAMVVATEANPRAAIITMFRRCSFLLIPMSIVLIRYFHELGTLQDKHWGSDIWCGVTTHKNPLGQMCIISALGFFWQLAEARRAGKRLWRQYLPWLYLAMTLYLFNGGGDSNSRSSTAILCLMLALAIYVSLARFKNRPEMVPRALAWNAVGLVVVTIVLNVFGSSLQATVAATQGKNATLSDRTYLWADVVRIGMKHPILGTGYGGFWVPSIYYELSPQVDNRPAEAHNGYLETFANLGMVGVALLACVIIQSLRNACKTIQSDFEYGRMRLALLLMALVMNYSEATFPRGNHLWWFGFLTFAIYAQPWVVVPEGEDHFAEEHESNEPIEEAVSA